MTIVAIVSQRCMLAVEVVAAALFFFWWYLCNYIVFAPLRLSITDVTCMTMPSHLHFSVFCFLLQCDVFHGDPSYCYESWFILVSICVNMSVSKYVAPPQPPRL